MTGASGAHAVSLAYDPMDRLFQTSGGASGTTQLLYDGDVAFPIILMAAIECRSEEVVGYKSDDLRGQMARGRAWK